MNIDTWKITLAQHQHVRHPRQESHLFEGSLAAALSRAMELEADQTFRVARVIVECDGPTPPNHDNITELRGALMQARETLNSRGSLEAQSEAIARADAALFLSGEDERRALGMTDWSNTKAREPGPTA